MEQNGKGLMSKQCPVPSQAQLALAIAIVNSKPANISVIDHLQQIRLHIKASRNHSPPSTNSSDKYFDSVAFWKQAYTKAEATQSVLNDRIYELEQRIETLKLKLKQDDSVCDTPERGKRKGSREPTVPDSQRKRKKTSNVSSGVVTTGEAELEQLNELISQDDSTGASQTGIGVNSVMRHLFVLQQNLQKRPNWAVIYASAINLCTATNSVVPFLYDNSGAEARQLNSTDSNIRVPNPLLNLAIIEASHSLLCRTLNKIMNSSERQKYEGQIVYHMSSLFETALYALEKICDYQTSSKELPKVKQNSKSPSAKNTKHQSSSESSNVTRYEVPTDEVLQTLRRVLAGMMLKATSLITTNPNTLFEGYLYVFLTHVGTVLSTLEFKDILTSPNLQASPDKLPLPDGLRRAIMNAKGEAIGTIVMARELETCHMIWLLEKAIALAHSMSMKSSLSQGTITPSDRKDSNAGILLGLSKKRLQNTLLKAVFDEEEPLFLESLIKPESLAGGEMTSPINKESETASEWFSREVWRLLGWDILESIWKNGKENHIQ
ncbi:hypothetical protein TSTA_092600 [Talaromyces stipitatus ATCC 10500]|uniref:Uncharacterized protein n=1 Tax=Talaromyces stipitatus (strain ATCC 10500 / CBS 375.48 / QM 6759 / NRRL 1006) TaxID=441959 RepID=B8M338_TALSN|nr:uncharacterized protein TSTA_092600 [Talaromyces stipitatus ATCC 10500]EED22014.1 hypothetical protein TSTA_092600 [Talaromyces stipitatus ATCC 10500]